MDFYNVMEMGRIRQAELIREAQACNRLGDQGLSAFDRAVIWFSEQMIVLGRALQQRYVMGLSNAERA